MQFLAVNVYKRKMISHSRSASRYIPGFNENSSAVGSLLLLRQLKINITQPPVQWVQGLSRGKVRLGRDADPINPSNAEVKI